MTVWDIRSRQNNLSIRCRNRPDIRTQTAIRQLELMTKSIEKALAKLKANTLRIFREIESSGEELTVADRNRAVVRVQPMARKRTVEEVFGADSGNVIYHEDVSTPTVDEWQKVR